MELGAAMKGNDTEWLGDGPAPSFHGTHGDALATAIERMERSIPSPAATSWNARLLDEVWPRAEIAEASGCRGRSAGFPL